MQSKRSAIDSSSISSIYRALVTICPTSRGGPGELRQSFSAPGRRKPTMSEPTARRMLRAAIFDVDGVLVASPHEQAWREALEGYADPSRFTTEFYQAN